MNLKTPAQETEPFGAAKIAELLRGVLPEKDRPALEAAMAKRIAGISTAEERRAFLDVFGRCGEDWGHQPGHPLAALLTVMVAESLLPPVGAISGLEHCREALGLASSGKAVAMISNHISYGDANILFVALEKNGLRSFPLMVMAGPKVYSDPFRKLMAMTFDSLKMAQPPSRASGDAAVSGRELALITRRVMSDAAAWQAKGRILFFFPEGSRSRSGAMERLIPASARYLMANDATVYPVGLSGTEGLMGVGSSRISAESIAIRAGRGMSMESLCLGLDALREGDRRAALMDRLGFAIAKLLPPKLQGVYRLDGAAPGEDPSLKDARDWSLSRS